MINITTETNQLVVTINDGSYQALLAIFNNNSAEVSDFVFECIESETTKILEKMSNIEYKEFVKLREENMSKLACNEGLFSDEPLDSLDSL